MLFQHTPEDADGRVSPSLADLEQKKKSLLDALNESTSETIKSNPSTPTQTAQNVENSSDNMSTPQSSIKGHVKSTSFGTPVLNSASIYSTLPSEDKFSKDICDVINFENLPDSTGKFEKIATLLKRVKSEVDRIHES